jgi:sugar/nucleoside kinase (ribokinase family)
MSAADTIIVAGNVCLDIIPQFPAAARLDPGTLVRVGPAVLASGGVSNVGVALHRLGASVKLIHKVGDDLFGQALKSIFAAIDPQLASGIRGAAGESTSYTVVISPPGVDRMFIHSPGANDTFGPGEIDDASLRGAKHLHLGYPPIMRTLLLDGGEGCAALFARARSFGVTTSLDLCSIDPASDAGRVDWKAWLARVLPNVDCFVPSFDELAFALHAPPQLSLANAKVLARRCLDLGAASVLLKAGDQGVYYAAPGVEAAAPAYVVDVASALGAGDCTVAGFLVARRRGDAIDDQLRFACGVGASCCEAPDATSGVPAADVIDERIAAGWKQRESIFVPRS